MTHIHVGTITYWNEDAELLVVHVPDASSHIIHDAMLHTRVEIIAPDLPVTAEDIIEQFIKNQGETAPVRSARETVRALTQQLRQAGLIDG